MPRFEFLCAQYGSDGLDVIGLNYLDTPTDITTFVASYGVTHPMVQVADASGYSFATFSTC